MRDVIDIAVKQPKAFRVDGKTFLLEFPLSAVIVLEAKLGRPMKGLSDWLKVSTGELWDVLEAGFRKHHEEESHGIATALCDGLEPEDIERVIDAVCVCACPRAMERLKEEMEKMRDRLKKGLPLPNVQSGAVS